LAPSSVAVDRQLQSKEVHEVRVSGLI